MTSQERFSSRKFGLAVFFALVSTFAVFTGDISGEEFVDIITSIIGLYALGNVGAAFVKNKEQ